MYRKTNNQILSQNLDVAQSFYKRAKGLLGCDKLVGDQGLWIHRCNSVHTWFMQFPIDVIFLDKNLSVKGIHKNLKPWKMTWPIFSAHTALEFRSGFVDEMRINLGDEFRVDT